MKQLPRRLYKYTCLDTRSLQNLKSQVVYFGPPTGFNDPYDCAVTPFVPVPTRSEVRKLMASLDCRNEVPPEAIRARKSVPISQLRELMHNTVKKQFRAHMAEFISKRGVACFSETPDDLLMWSHYGGQYQGLCLEFDTTLQPFSRARPVDYVKKLPEITVSTILGLDEESSAIETDYEPIERLFRTKSDAWSYEREWRAIHDVAGTEYVYEAPALTGIYFGPDIDFTSVEIVCLVMRGQNRTVKFFSGMRSSRDFKVEFKEFRYTDFLTAEEQGLKREGERSQVWPIPQAGQVSYHFRRGVK
jgi:hypothetical protein